MAWKETVLKYKSEFEFLISKSIMQIKEGYLKKNN